MHWHKVCFISSSIQARSNCETLYNYYIELHESSKLLLSLLIQTIGDGRSGGLVNDAQDIHACEMGFDVKNLAYIMLTVDE